MYNAYHMDYNVCSYKQKADCKAKESKNIQFSMEIPTKLGKTCMQSKDKLLLEEYRQLTPSFNGKQLVVTYELELTIKHSGWNTDGKGKCVKLPVWIHSSTPMIRDEEYKNQQIAAPIQPIMVQ